MVSSSNTVLLVNTNRMRPVVAPIGLDYRQEAARVENHTLVIVGSDDAATPPALGMDLVQRMPHAAYHELPGLAHAPQLQDPELFLQAVIHFLEDDA